MQQCQYIQAGIPGSAHCGVGRLRWHERTHPEVAGGHSGLGALFAMKHSRRKAIAGERLLTLLAIGGMFVGGCGTDMRPGSVEEVVTWLKADPGPGLQGIPAGKAHTRVLWFEEGKNIGSLEPVLEGLLERRDPRVSADQVAEILGAIGDVHSVPVLERALMDKGDEDLRGEAALALGRMRATRSTRLLAAGVAGDPCGNVRFRCVIALGEIRGEAAKEAVRRAADDSDPFVRGQAMLTLVDFGGPDARRAILRGLQDEDKGVVLLARHVQDVIEKKREPATGTTREKAVPQERRGMPPGHE